jgi:hypothetical protein
VTKDTWKPAVGMEDGAVVVEEQEFLQKNVDCFAFGLHDLGVLKGQEVRITLTNDAPIYRKPYKYSDTERKMIQARIAELVEAGLVELAPPDCEYASATVMPSKKDIYGNWTSTVIGPRRGCAETIEELISSLSRIVTPCQLQRRILRQ